MLTCQRCGEVSPERARFCIGCGSAFSAAALPVEVRRVSVVFADIAGSTALIAGADPDDARALLDGVVQTMREAVHQFAGVVTRIAGDGIVALFGAPVAVEDHARRACMAALRMQADISLANAQAQRDNTGPIRIRVGINSGDVLLRSVSSDLHLEYSAEGETTHLAAKAEQAADPGTVLVTAEVARLVEGFVETRPHAPLHVPGLREPVALFELVGVTGVQSRFQVAVRRGLAGLVGREQELERLERAAAQAEDGVTQIVGVVGDAGVGKSRLLWELRRRLQARGWSVLATHSTVGGARSAFFPVLSVLRMLYAIEPGDDAQRIAAKLTDALPAGAGAVDLPPLRVLFDQPAGEVLWDSLDESRRLERTHRALASVLLNGCQQRTTAIVIDDLHEADSETREFLRRLAKRPEAARLLLLLEHRPGYDLEFERAPRFDAVGIGPLARPMAVALFRQLAGADSSLAALENALIDRAAGNAFFIEESVRMLSETAFLSGCAGDYRANTSHQAWPIPGSVRDVLESRIARLREADRDVLQIAAIFGKEIHLPILQALSGSDATVLRGALHHLIDAGLMVGSDGPHEYEFAFKHAVTQDVAYHIVNKAQRKAVHARIVGVLESPLAASLAERPELLAHHAVKAQDWERAVDYLQKAAHRAAERSAFREAVRLLDEALGVASSTQRPVACEIDARLALRGPLLALGNVSRVSDEVRRLEALTPTCVDMIRQARVAVFVSGHRWLTGQHSKAVEAGRQAMTLARSLDDVSLLVPARQYVGGALHELGQYAEAEELLTANVVDVPADKQGHLFGMAGLPAVFCRATRGWLHEHLGNFACAQADAVEALRIGKAAGHTFSIMSASFCVGSLHLARGEFAAAERVLGEALALCESERQRMWLPILGAMLALALAKSGNITWAGTLIDRAVPRPDDPVLSTTIMLTVAETQWLIQRTDAATRLAEAALQRARRLGEQTWQAEALWLVALMAEHGTPPDPAAAQAAYLHALRQAEDLGMRPLAARCRLGLAWLHARGGSADTAMQYAAQAAAEFTALQLPYWIDRVHEVDSVLARHA